MEWFLTNMHKSNEITLKEAITEMLEMYRLDSKLNEYKITDVWEKVMGKGIANYTKEIKLKNNKLFVSLSNAPLKSELHYAREKIIKSVNDFYGKEVVKEIILK